jgi:hypothetical protein
MFYIHVVHPIKHPKYLDELSYFIQCLEKIAPPYELRYPYYIDDWKLSTKIDTVSVKTSERHERVMGQLYDYLRHNYAYTKEYATKKNRAIFLAY